MIYPEARSHDLIINDLETDTLIYDEQRHHIHSLNHVSRTVWRLCNGQRPVDELTRLAGHQLGIPLTEADTRIALSKLSDARLLTSQLPPESRQSTISRRALGKRAAALAVVISISAPTAAAAASPNRNCVEYSNECSTSDDCCGSMYCNWSGICDYL